MLNTMYFPFVFNVMLCKDVRSEDLKQILIFVIPHSAHLASFRFNKVEERPNCGQNQLLAPCMKHLKLQRMKFT